MINQIVNNNSLQIALVSAIVFIFVAFPPLFYYVDVLLSMILSNKIGSNRYIVLVIHAIVFGILIFLFSSYLFQPMLHWVKDKDTDKKEDILDSFKVGGQLTCGGSS